MITHQAFCGSLLAGERKSDRPYVCAIVQHGFDARIYREMVQAAWHNYAAANIKDHIRYNRARAAVKAGETINGRLFPTKQSEIDDAVLWLNGQDDAAIMDREYARHTTEGEETIERTLAKGPQVLSWHMTADNGTKALAAARGKSWLRCWALALVPASAKPVKARKAAQATSPSSVG